MCLCSSAAAVLNARIVNNAIWAGARQRALCWITGCETGRIASAPRCRRRCRRRRRVLLRHVTIYFRLRHIAQHTHKDTEKHTHYNYSHCHSVVQTHTHTQTRMLTQRRSLARKRAHTKDTPKEQQIQSAATCCADKSPPHSTFSGVSRRRR